MDTTHDSPNLLEWVDANEPSSDMYFATSFWDQVVFVRDQLPALFSSNYDERCRLRDNIRVISTHNSKSIKLPVYRFETPDGTTFIMRYNFHNWIVSVESPTSIWVQFKDLFDSNYRVQSVYAEGIPDEHVHGSYGNNQRNFTVELPAGYYAIYVFFWLISRCRA